MEIGWEHCENSEHETISVRVCYVRVACGDLFPNS